jgi:glutaredoxin 3
MKSITLEKEKQKMLLEKTVFKMYIKDNCPYCDKARDIILNDLRASLHLVNITSQPDLRELIIKETGQKTVPAIYIGDDFIGGCDELVALCESDKVEIKILREENSILRDEVLHLRRGL